ncbi:MAG: hypothetical protein ACOX2O_08730 [Bdellovibrionota bacterium]
MQKAKSNYTQIRLLLPEEWVPELDNLAASRFLSRLGLIRFYLRAGLDEDLSQFAEHLRLKDEQKRIHAHIAEQLEDREW